MSAAASQITELRERAFGSHHELIRLQAKLRPAKLAMALGDRTLDYAGLDQLMDRIAAGIQRDGVQPGESIAICASMSIEYGAVFMGAIRAGAGVAPLAPSSTPDSIMTMLADCSAKIVFLDASVASALAPLRRSGGPIWVTLDDSAFGVELSQWLPPDDAQPAPVDLDPQAAFNIIYSSGTTGAPKGIVQSHHMRWNQLRRDPGHNYDADASKVVLISTPLYSNTTLVSFLPALAAGATVVLLPKFEAVKFLQLAEKYRVTDVMLVPVQYQRIMAVPDFDKYDLSSFVNKASTSAPFSAELKADVLKRWPGGLTEYYGMTEGGGSCRLLAHERPDKLHTVGCPMPGHDMRLIDENGNEVPQGAIGEVVGRSPLMMNGYFNQPKKTSEAEWYDKEGNRYIRTGDVGRFDEDGFLTLMDRKKDMIISGGFNVYPSDLEAVLAQHEAVLEAAVVGIPSEQWGETPVAFVTLSQSVQVSPDEVLRWTNERLGKMQRITAVRVVPTLPRSAIGKVLKRELRESYGH